MDIEDGKVAYVQGSGKKPYELKNVGGVYSCNCPAWRNQSLSIESRTCKHLRKYRGDAAEELRINTILNPLKEKAEKEVPGLLLAHDWDGIQDLTNWWISEKYDGVRAYWDGSKFFSRAGNQFAVPDYFTKNIPSIPLDGEFWIGRKLFDRTSGFVRRKDEHNGWKEIKFLVFDAPNVTRPFEERVSFIQQFASNYLVPVNQRQCNGSAHLVEELKKIEEMGGEGLMLRKPNSYYESGRSNTLLKVKSFKDAEAIVIGYEKGKGKHKGRVGALNCQLKDGKEFSIGTGLSDRERENPPKIGQSVTFRYFELTENGIPRFPSFIRIFED